MKAMISQPMAGRTTAEIEEVKRRAIKFLQKLNYEIVDTYFTDEYHNGRKAEEEGIVSISLHFLARSLLEMSKCDAVYFCEGWERARGCVCEHGVAQAYGLKILYEDCKEVYCV